MTRARPRLRILGLLVLGLQLGIWSVVPIADARLHAETASAAVEVGPSEHGAGLPAAADCPLCHLIQLRAPVAHAVTPDVTVRLVHFDYVPAPAVVWRAEPLLLSLPRGPPHPA